MMIEGLLRPWPANTLITLNPGIDFFAYMLYRYLRHGSQPTEWNLPRGQSLVICGFPRSGNSFLRFVLERRIRKEVHLYSHGHNPLDIEMARRRKIPVMVPFRQPLDTVSSLMVYFGGVSDGSATRFLSSYIAFHRFLAKLPESRSVALLNFDIFTRDLDPVTQFVAKFLDSSQEAVFLDPQSELELMRKEASSFVHAVESGEQLANRIPVPTAQRVEQLHASRAILTSPGIRPALSTAQQIYESLAARY